jgi:hypothetical protein
MQLLLLILGRKVTHGMLAGQLSCDHCFRLAL